MLQRYAYKTARLKHLLVSISFLAFTFYGKAQTENKIVIGTVDSIQSKILNEKRKIWIYVPPNDGTSRMLSLIIKVFGH